jgi:uncharacterized protein (DUF1499 family)
MRDHVRSVFEKSATKFVSKSVSNGCIHTSNEYMQTAEGQQMSRFYDDLDMYLTEEQYVMVNHVGLNFISCLLYFYYF